MVGTRRPWWGREGMWGHGDDQEGAEGTRGHGGDQGTWRGPGDGEVSRALR